MTAINATAPSVRASMFQAIRSGLRCLTGLGSSPKPRRTRRQFTRLENLEERVVLSWGAVPPAALSFHSVPTTHLGSGIATGTGQVSTTTYYDHAFTAPSSGIYLFGSIAAKGSNLDTVLGVYNNYGQRIASNDDATNRTTNSLAFVRLNAGQTVFITVSPYNGKTSGSFTWVAAEVVAAANIPPSLNTQQTISLPSIQQSEASIRQSNAQSANLTRLGIEQQSLNIGGDNFGDYSGGFDTDPGY